MTQDKDIRNGVWVTPRSFFDPIQSEFNLEVDAAASLGNNMLPRFWDEKCDAFEQDWKGLRIWCNPPYKRDKIYKWVQYCAYGNNAAHADHKPQICVALLPARTDTRWFHEFIYNKPNVEIRFVKGRIKFSGMKGSGKFPSMVCIFR